jgi:hypothetical protein
MRCRSQDQDIESNDVSIETDKQNSDAMYDSINEDGVIVWTIPRIGF